MENVKCPKGVNPFDEMRANVKHWSQTSARYPVGVKAFTTGRCGHLPGTKKGEPIFQQTGTSARHKVSFS